MMNARSKKAEPCKPSYDRAYHIDWNTTLDRWDVIDDDGWVHGHSRDLHHGTNLAIQKAHNDHGAGRDVIVCVQQEDGTCTMTWPSR
jgi:hypothetical protein